MALHAREKISRRSWLAASLALPLSRAHAIARLNVSSDGDDLHVEAPQLHFLTGKPLARLMDGNTVVFRSLLTLLGDDHVTPFRAQQERIIVSYDLWDEQFKVVLSVNSRSVKHLSLPETEDWCLRNLSISAQGIEPERPFFLRFDLRTSSERESAPVAGDTGISIRGLIEEFSRKAGAGDLHWGPLDAGPLRLVDLPRMVIRRARNE
jgi:hypothetical protein